MIYCTAKSSWRVIGKMKQMEGHVNAETLRKLQAPLKSRYRDDPQSAKMTLKALGHLGAANISCTVETHTGPIEAGLHPATGGDGTFACSGDMLLEALVGCAGVTLI